MKRCPVDKTDNYDDSYSECPVCGHELDVVASAPQPAPAINLTAEPSTIQKGESCTLRWSSENADTFTLDPGIGAVQPQGFLTVSPSKPTTYILTATGPGGSVTAEAHVNIKVPPLVPTVSLTVDPSVVQKGKSCTLRWSSENAEKLTLDPGNRIVHPQEFLVVSPRKSTKYTVRATGVRGSETAEAHATVTVISRRAPTAKWILAFILLAIAGAWVVKNVTHSHTVHKKTAPHHQSPSAPRPTTPRRMIPQPQKPNKGNGELTNPHPQAVPTQGRLMPTGVLTAEPLTITKGGTCTLHWTSQNASIATLEPGIGFVPVQGHVTVSPGKSTTYVLSIGSPGGKTAKDEVRVNVIVPAPPPSASLKIIPASITEGQSAKLSWSTKNVTNVTIEPDIGPVKAHGSLQVMPEQSTTYTIRATGEGRSVGQSVSIKVMPPPSQQGVIVWEGQIRGTTVVSIENGQASRGRVISGSLPGLPCMLVPDAKHGRVAVQTAPGPWNSWNLIVLRVRGNGKTTIRLKWSLLH